MGSLRWAASSSRAMGTPLSAEARRRAERLEELQADVEEEDGVDDAVDREVDHADVVWQEADLEGCRRRRP